MTTDTYQPIRLSTRPCETGQQYRLLEQQGYRISTSRYACGCVLRTGKCKPCHWPNHNKLCQPFQELDHCLVAIKDGRRYLYTWIYNNIDQVEQIAHTYAARHHLVFRVGHPDDDLYCGGATPVRYWIP